jgi:hypothetical protein
MDERLKIVIDRLDAATGELDALRQLVVKVRERLAGIDQPAEMRKLAESFAKSVDDHLDRNGSTLAEASTAARSLAEGGGEPAATAAIAPDALVGQIRALIDGVHDAPAPEGAEAVSTLTHVDVEVKGLIVVEHEEARIVPPHPDRPIDAAQLSTIRLSFGAVPVVRGAAPAPEPPAPPPRRRRRPG